MVQKNVYREIKPQWRLIHDALHSNVTHLTVGRVEYEIGINDRNCRYIDYDNIRFVEQNKRSFTENGEKARNGERITWCTPHDNHAEVFVIDMHSMLAPINAATISIKPPVKPTKDEPVKTKRARKSKSEGAKTPGKRSRLGK